MSRGFSNYDRHERRGFGGTDNWDSDLEYGIDDRARDRPMRRSGWQGSPVTGYHEAPEIKQRAFSESDWDRDEDRYRNYRGRPQRVNWGRDPYDERRQESRGYDLDHDVYRSGDRDEWRGEFGPKEDRTQWGRGRDRDWRGGYGEPYRERRYEQRDFDRSGDRFGEMDDVRVRYGQDYGDVEGDREWRRAGRQEYRQQTDWTRGPERNRWMEADRGDYYPDYDRDDDREFDRDRDWGRANRGGWNTNRVAGRGGSQLVAGQRRTGPYAGRGPRGFQRSDERIREDINEILWEHDEIDASDIDVRVENGEVTLEGTVDSRWTKRMAEDAAHEARGVHDVHNRLRVRREQEGTWDRGTDRMADSRIRTTPQGATTGTVRMEGARTDTGVTFAPGTIVVGADGDEVGTIKEVRDESIVVDRATARDVYVPFSAVETTDGSTARLRVNSGDVDDQGWQNPPATGTDTDYNQSVQMV